MLRISPEDKALLGRVLPFKSHYLEVAGYDMHYLDEGQGPVIVLLHGNPTWSFMFRGLIEVLKSEFRVIAPDYIGLGLSDRVHERSFRAIERTDQVEEFLDALKIDQFSLVMHDWGGSIGSMVAIRNPSRVEKLVYFNTTLTEIESLPELIKRATTPVVGKILTKYSTSFLRLLTEMGSSKRLSHEVKQAYLLPYRSTADRQAIWDFVADIPFNNEHPSHGDLVLLGEKLPLLEAKPVQIVWGLKDPCFHREMLSKVARHFPQAEVLELPEASHLLLEDAIEKVSRAVLGFLMKPVVKTPEAEILEKSLLGKTNALYKEFLEQSKAAPERQAVIVPAFSSERPSYSYTSYRELQETINQYRRGLHSLGLEKGSRVLMLVSPGVDFLALSYAVMAQGAVPVFVDPGVGREKLLQCMEDSRADGIVASLPAFALKLFRRDLFKTFKFQLAAVDWPLPFLTTLSYMKRFSTAPLEAISNDGTALIAFTSGATGSPKGVVFTNEMMSEQLAIFKDVFKLKAGNKNLSLLPVFSLFSAAC
ncbi:MAG: alpha/beta fold hydrolase [SAR324 cluster bacterium]|uniref:Alpha/beta fold hydrolase n=1 Tax=SAR324 cluster bacterium TaxID=2024889 RepID=A0A7X9FRP8_9DELT|nr:alpha/beta fold hydrolase [SAR324 cluster bacterium]